MAHTRPLGKYLWPLIGILAVILTGLIGSLILSSFWGWVGPVLMIVLVGSVIAVTIKFGLNRLTNTLTALAGVIRSLFVTPLIKGVAMAILQTAIYGLILWFVYGLVSGWLVSEVGVNYRWSWFFITILALLALPAIWHLYAASGIPGSPEVITKARRVLLPVVLIFFGWWYWESPLTMFDHQTGNSVFWVADEEGKIYFSPGFSPVTGEELRLGTPEDAEKFRRPTLKDATSDLVDSLKAVIPEAAAKEEGLATAAVVDFTKPMVVELPADGSLSDPLPQPPAGGILSIQKSGDIYFHIPRQQEAVLVKHGEGLGRTLTPKEKQLRFSSATGLKETVVVRWK